MSKYEHMIERNYKDFSIRMSNKKMADVMYAVFMTGARIICTFHMDWSHKYTRKQNGYNSAEVRIDINPEKEIEFQEIAGVQLREIPQIQIN